MFPALIAPFAALLGGCLFAQQPKVVGGALESRIYLQDMIVSATPAAQMQTLQRTLRISDLQTVKVQGHNETQARVSFVKDKEPHAVAADFLFACVHNIERGRNGASPWRLRRAVLQRDAGKAERWAVEELAFAFVQPSAEPSPSPSPKKKPEEKAKEAAASQPQPLRAGRDVLRQVLALLRGSESELARAHQVTIDFTTKKPVVTAQVRALGDDFKKRFFAVESKLVRRDQKARRMFRDVRWAGDESPLEGAKGADFTIEFDMRQS